MSRQKRYRELIPMTFEEYLDEPPDVIEWTLRIDAIEREHQQQQKQREAPNAGHRAR